ncbi:MAG: uroporphyrinogen-III synthase [Microthrixaceae bacterium]
MSGASGCGVGGPLAGRRVVVTRAAHQAAELVDALEASGAETVLAPCIAIEEPADGGRALREAVGRLAEYRQLVVTSPNGAARLCSALRALGRSTGLPGGVALAAIGPGTAEALARCGLSADLVPDRSVAEALLDALGGPPEPGARLLLVRAEVGRNVLPDGLAARGWEVDVVAAYRTVTPPPDPELARLVSQADAVAFTSSSTVTGYVARFGAASVPPVVACISPVTGATARRAGLTPDVEASVHTVPGLVEALAGALGAATALTSSDGWERPGQGR